MVTRRSAASIGAAPAASHRWAGLALVLLAAASAPACNKAGSVGDDQAGPKTRQAAPESPPEQAKQPTGSNVMAATVEVLGFKLGGPYRDALDTAKPEFRLSGDGELYSGEGALNGMPGTLQLEGRQGALHDLQLRVTVPDGDPGLDRSPLFARLQTALGAANSTSADEASWAAGPWEVFLYRETLYDKGSDTPRVQYEVRARMRPSASPGPNPADADAKAREQGGR